MGDPEVEVERRLATALATARARWPTVVVDPAAFVAHAAPRRPPGVALDRWLAEELYLVVGVLAGDPAAVGILEAEFLTPLDRALARFDDPALADDARQVLRARILVAGDDGQPPKLAAFTGKGPLAKWLEVAAVRTAVSLRRGRREIPVDDGAMANLHGAGDDPRLAHLKDAYAPEFAAAWRAALRELAPKDRTLLRLHVLDGLSVERLGALHGVHGTTAARWIREIRRRLGDSVRDGMAAKLGCRPGEIDSIVELIRSRMDVTLGGLLSEDAELEKK